MFLLLDMSSVRINYEATGHGEPDAGCSIPDTGEVRDARSKGQGINLFNVQR